MCMILCLHQCSKLSLTLLEAKSGGVRSALTRDRWIPVSREFEPQCFLEHETLLPLLGTGWFQERIRA